MTALRSVSALPDLQGPAAWNRILCDPPPAVPLDTAVTADVTIVGAGFAGVTAARRLLQIDPSLKIVILDACRIADGSAGRNSGFMIDLPHDLTSQDYAGSRDDRTVIALNRKAIAFARDAVDAYQIDRNYFDPVGKVNGAATERGHAHNKSYARHLDRLGEAHQFLDQRQMRALTGSGYYLCGLHTPGTVMLQPAGYVRGMVAGLRRDGVRVFENSPVTGYRRSGSAWRIETPEGRVSTAKIVLAVNGHLESFGYAGGRLMQLFLFAAMTPVLDRDTVRRLGGASRWGVTPSDPMGTTMRRIDTAQGGNRIITRTCAVLRPNLRSNASDLARAAAVMQRKFEQRFPQLTGLEMAYRWAGHLCLTRNAVAVTGMVEEGVYAACVQNGLGTTRGTLTGICAAERACGVDSEITRHFEAEAAPKKLPPQPFQEIGANLLLRWKEWRAGAE